MGKVNFVQTEKVKLRVVAVGVVVLVVLFLVPFLLEEGEEAIAVLPFQVFGHGALVAFCLH
jgi:hypothetical protein